MVIKTVIHIKIRKMLIYQITKRLDTLTFRAIEDLNTMIHVGQEHTWHPYVGDVGSIPGLGRSPGEGNWLPTPVFLPGEFHGQRNLAGYNPWEHKESDMPE